MIKTLKTTVKPRHSRLERYGGLHETVARG